MLAAKNKWYDFAQYHIKVGVSRLYLRAIIMVAFDNTEIAFKSKSSKELKSARKLFKMIGSPTMQKVGKVLTIMSFKLHLPVKGIIKRTIFKQFCGGETIGECDGRIANLHQYGIGTILDFSVEGKQKEEIFDATCDEIIATVEKANEREEIPFAVFKPTGIANTELLEKASDVNANLTDEERHQLAKVHDRFDRICKRAYDTGTPLFIDAEDSWYQDTIDRMVDTMMARYNKERVVVYNTIQLYRHDRLQFLKTSHEKAKQNGYKIGMKLVRGAYMEKERERAREKGYPDPIQPNKKATDRDYDAALTYCITHINDIATCSGTHNEESSKLLIKLLAENNISIDHPHVYSAQLLGMSDHISYNLSNAGYNVAKYVPYGPVKEVLPYLIRRAEENTSVAGQTGRELVLIDKEIERRKIQT